MSDPVKEETWVSPDWKEVAKSAGTMPVSPAPPTERKGGVISSVLDWMGIKQASDRQFPIQAPAPAPTSLKPSTAPSEGFNMEAYKSKLTATESGGDNNAKSPTSSATGPHQFTSGTWTDVVKKMGADYSLADRTNPEKSGKVLDRLTTDNIASAKKDLGRAPTMTEAYMYHFVGRSAPGLIQAPPDKPAKDYITAAQYEANKSVFAGKTVGEVLNKFKNRFK